MGPPVHGVLVHSIPHVPGYRPVPTVTTALVTSHRIDETVPTVVTMIVRRQWLPHLGGFVVPLSWGLPWPLLVLVMVVMVVLVVTVGVSLLGGRLAWLGVLWLSLFLLAFLHSMLVDLVELPRIKLCELGHKRPQVVAPLLDALKVVELMQTLVDVVTNLEQTAPNVVQLLLL